MHRPQILIVDDDPAIVKFVRANLKAQGYEVLAAGDGGEALETIERELPELVILDIMLPGMDGFETCRRLREWSQMPIIMLSARGDEEDKVKCLGLGADDYITKPFGVGELLARVKAILRRAERGSTPPAQTSFSRDCLEINFAQRRVTIAGEEVRLTPTEYQLLQELALNAGKVLTHAHLLRKVWGMEYMDAKEYLHEFIRRVRSKIEAGGPGHKFIVSVSGVGYRFKDKN